jgi:acetyl-CoA carboxylase biotin carboxyl carrier protein
MTIKSQDIDVLIQIFESSAWDEMHLKIEDVEVFLSTDPNGRMPGVSGSSPATASPPAATAGIAPAPPATAGSGGRASTAGLAPAAPPQANWVAVTAPNLGTFYRAAKPGSPSFVEIGQAVEPDTEICLIEVMKLFTTLKAGVKGIVRQVCVKDAAMVEFGETLFYIEPA